MLTAEQQFTLTKLLPEQRQQLRKRLVKEGRYLEAMESLRFCYRLENYQRMAEWLLERGAVETK
jgi:hypothetical protein